MTELVEAWTAIPERFRALVVFMLLLLVFVSFGRFVARYLHTALSRRRKVLGSNVVPMRKPHTFADRFQAAQARVRGPLNPAWLVIAAIAMLLLVRSGIWFEIIPGETLTGRVTHIRDGDTIEVNNRPIRLNGLTCDERGTVLGERATGAMLRLAARQTVTCQLNGERTYDREVGRCALSDGRDLGAELIAQGVCGRCARYDPLRSYASVQSAAGPFPGANPQYCWSPW